MNTSGHQHDNSLVPSAFGFLCLLMNFQPYDSDADWAITSVPFNVATSGRAGDHHGPAAIRQVSTNLIWEYNRFPWNFDMRECLNVADCGDSVYVFGDARETNEKLQAHAERLLVAGKRILSFGDDHFVTLPLLRAHVKHLGKMALVHFNVHADAYTNGHKFDHGTMFYTAPKEGLVDPNHSVQTGIRTKFGKDNGFIVLDACQMNDRNVDDIIAQVRRIMGDMSACLTFDIDCLDPAFTPGTGTPVISGLTSDRAIKLVCGLKDLNIAGVDVVEVAPTYDQSEVTALTVATLVLKMPYIQAAEKGEQASDKRHTSDVPLMSDVARMSYPAYVRHYLALLNSIRAHTITDMLGAFGEYRVAVKH